MQLSKVPGAKGRDPDPPVGLGVADPTGHAQLAAGLNVVAKQLDAASRPLQGSAEVGAPL